MRVTLMPRDITTRWNSTLGLLDYALKHWKVVDLVTQRRELGLREYKLTDNEWAIVEQLRNVLKVRKKKCCASMFDY